MAFVLEVKINELIWCTHCENVIGIEKGALNRLYSLLQQVHDSHFPHVSLIKSIFYQELLKEKCNPRLKANRKGIIVKDKEFYIPIFNTFPTR